MELGDLLSFTPSPELRPVGSTFLDGPRVAIWIHEHHRDLKAQLGKDLRHVERWAEGTSPKLPTVDRVLARLGSHVHQLPPDVWVSSPLQRPLSKLREEVAA